MNDSLLYQIKKARPDLELLLYFLITQVSKSYEDDWKHLKVGLVWVKNTTEDKRVMVARLFSKRNPGLMHCMLYKIK